MAINIMITDDHSMIREGLKNLLELDGDIKVIAEAENNGYVLKDSESAELKKAIFTIADGETYIQPSLIPALNSKMIEKNEDELKIDALTKRELEVLKEMAVGKFNRDIAKEMKISERTVKNHISSIFKKLEVTDRTQAAVFAIRNNIIQIM